MINFLSRIIYNVFIKRQSRASNEQHEDEIKNVESSINISKDESQIDEKKKDKKNSVQTIIKQEKGNKTKCTTVENGRQSPKKKAKSQKCCLIIMLLFLLLITMSLLGYFLGKYIKNCTFIYSFLFKWLSFIAWDLVRKQFV